MTSILTQSLFFAPFLGYLTANFSAFDLELTLKSHLKSTFLPFESPYMTFYLTFMDTNSGEIYDLFNVKVMDKNISITEKKKKSFFSDGV